MAEFFLWQRDKNDFTGLKIIHFKFQKKKKLDKYIYLFSVRAYLTKTLFYIAFVQSQISLSKLLFQLLNLF